MVRLPEDLDDSRWDPSEISDALEHYLSLDRCTLEELEARLESSGVLARIPIAASAGDASRFQVLALAAQDLWLADRLGPRSADQAHFARLRARFFAALRVLGEHGASLEKAGLVILDPGRPWVAPLLAEAMAEAPIRTDAGGMPKLVMPTG